MTDPHAPRAIAPSWVTARSTAFLSDPAARVAGNAVATTDVDKLTLDRAIVTSIDTSVSDLIPDAAVTDQKRSGRCWTFAGLNVLRTAYLATSRSATAGGGRSSPGSWPSTGWFPTTPCRTRIRRPARRS